jgi:hypothetical protein
MSQAVSSRNGLRRLLTSFIPPGYRTKILGYNRVIATNGGVAAATLLALVLIRAALAWHRHVSIIAPLLRYRPRRSRAQSADTKHGRLRTFPCGGLPPSEETGYEPTEPCAPPPSNPLAAAAAAAAAAGADDEASYRTINLQRTSSSREGVDVTEGAAKRTGESDGLGTRGADGESRRSMGQTGCTCFIFGAKEEAGGTAKERAAKEGPGREGQLQGGEETERTGKDTFT